VKSHITDLLEVMQAIYYDACAHCNASVSERDLKTIRSRVENEGLSFLTITLPTFGKGFEKSLDQGFVAAADFNSFRKSGAIPAFLQGMLGQIFDTETGRINDEYLQRTTPQRVSRLIVSIRQICLAFKKLKIPCTPKRTAEALESFIENERTFNVLPLPKADHRLFEAVSAVLWDNLMGGLRLSDFRPKHGPGQTAERASGNRKYRWRRWHNRLEPYFPLLDSAFSASCGELGFSSQELKDVSVVHEDDEQPVRVITVPKSLKAPRIIAIEPCCMQYTQQAIASALMRALQSSVRTRGHINFSDQSVNQRLALSSSFDGRLATIDLSDASDRVPIGYALQMFRGNRDLLDAIEACRSTRAKMPDGRIVRLRKFASMGSALCFPIEAMYFYTICVVALLRYHNLPVSHANVDKCSRDVYVYGDDILVPSDAALTVLDSLRKYNCKVNTSKTFFTGRFRESCGVDAYNGEQVTPLYVNRLPPENRQQPGSLVSWVATANHFASRGWYRVSQLFFNRVEKILGALPWVSETSPALGRYHPWPTVPRKRFNRKLQRLEIRCWVTAPVYRTDRLVGYAALQKSLMKLEGLTDLLAQRDRFHLERSALHGEVAINLRWIPATFAGRWSK
jgi:hypothetical protein